MISEGVGMHRRRCHGFSGQGFCIAAGEGASTGGVWSWAGDGDCEPLFSRWLMGGVNVAGWSFVVMFLHLKQSRKERAMLNKNFIIWRAILIAGMVIGVAGIVGEMVWSAEKGQSEEAEARQVVVMATSVKIELVGAMKTALESVAGQVIKAGLEKHGDKIAWNVEILTTGEAIMTVYVDAVSGSVMMTKEKVAGKKPIQGKTA
jgi:hypothetical protein